MTRNAPIIQALRSLTKEALEVRVQNVEKLRVEERGSSQSASASKRVLEDALTPYENPQRKKSIVTKPKAKYSWRLVMAGPRTVMAAAGAPPAIVDRRGWVWV